MRRITVFALAMGLTLGAAACGKKGPLDRPEPEKKDETQSSMVLPR